MKRTFSILIATTVAFSTVFLLTQDGPIELDDLIVSVSLTPVQAEDLQLSPFIPNESNKVVNQKIYPRHMIMSGNSLEVEVKKTERRVLRSS
ncbi:MAG: hypothetical protein OXE41_10680 [Gammaproteobacteria bacterium]|nr:hypothetical protein [Gammaproteobacteria bacterium]MCY4220019.1 hypothetical protein [Gammaproteobacteria bacterium]MCY4275839.1 hypothetical protein [Gammaproteobacteria bacterium]